MQWNEVDYDNQMKVVDRISDLLDKERDPIMLAGIIAAIHELEIWSNSPCIVIEYDFDDETPFVAEAVDNK
jgi:hypothetical protein